MSRPLRIQYPGAVYHVTCRGNERRDIFRDDADRVRFIEQLKQSAEIYSVKLYGYVLMSNHFHLLVETPLGNLGEFMRRFNIGYTGYFNRRHRRVGHLYQGRYKSLLVERDAYLSMLSRYIHLNPVKVAGWKRKPVEEQEEHLKGYRWSSLPGYIDKRKREGFIDYDMVLGAYGGDSMQARKQYWNDVIAGMKRSTDLKAETTGQSIVGSDEFVRWVKDEFLKDRKDRECPPLRALTAYRTQDEILAAIKAVTGKDLKALKEDRGSLRQIAMELLHRHGGMKGKEIGDLLGVDYSTVSVGRKRLREKMTGDRGIARMVGMIEGELADERNAALK